SIQTPNVPLQVPTNGVNSFAEPIIGASAGSVERAGSFCARGAADLSWYCWGRDIDGQLDIVSGVGGSFANVTDSAFTAGLETPSPMVDLQFAKTAPFLSLGANHGCAVTQGTNAAVYCFGDN